MKIRNIIKKAVILSAALMMLAATSAVKVDAATDGVSGLCSFYWTQTTAKITNKTNDYRFVEATINVYRRNTGSFVHSFYDSNVGTYDVSATATNNTYTGSSYYVQCIGVIYNSGSPSSGEAWNSGERNVI